MKRIMIVVWLLVGAFAVMSLQESPQPEQKIVVLNPGWRIGKVPLGPPVVGIWIHGGEIVTRPCVMTDYAGLYEYSTLVRPVMPLPDPDYWAPMPVGNP